MSCDHNSRFMQFKLFRSAQKTPPAPIFGGQKVIAVVSGKGGSRQIHDYLAHVGNHAAARI